MVSFMVQYYIHIDSRDSTMCSIVDQLVPASYLQLQDVIQSLASDCRLRNNVPIYDKETYRLVSSINHKRQPCFVSQPEPAFFFFFGGMAIEGWLVGYSPNWWLAAKGVGMGGKLKGISCFKYPKMH